MTYNDPTHGNVLLLDVFGNPAAWIEDRYNTLDERWVSAGVGEDLAYRDASQAGANEQRFTIVCARRAYDHAAAPKHIPSRAAVLLQMRSRPSR